jgi:4-hydroxybenzoate polyprenyltransferase
MATAARAALPATLLRLGRISNLPTVWTNVLAGTVLAGGAADDRRVALVALAMSLLYMGGMYLNDYFDRDIDARERPMRPIPAGDISASVVAIMGFALLAVGVALLALAGTAALVVGLALALSIVGYDIFHKGNPVAPLVMGLCRAFVYAGAAAAATGTVLPPVIAAGLAMLAFVAGVSFAARQERLDRVGNLWPLAALAAPIVLTLPAYQNGMLAADVHLALTAAVAYAVYLLAKRPTPAAVPRAVVTLIAGISLVDAAFLASVGAVNAALIAVLGFVATVLAQRYVAGT